MSHLIQTFLTHQEKGEDTNECSVEKTAHIDVLPASNAGGTDALNQAIDKVAKIATRLQAASDAPERIARLNDDLDWGSNRRGRNRC